MVGFPVPDDLRPCWVHGESEHRHLLLLQAGRQFWAVRIEEIGEHAEAVIKHQHGQPLDLIFVFVRGKVVAHVLDLLEGLVAARLQPGVKRALVLVQRLQHHEFIARLKQVDDVGGNVTQFASEVISHRSVSPESRASIVALAAERKRQLDVMFPQKSNGEGR